MSVTKEELAQYVAELGLPQDQTDSLVSTLMGNEKAATQFVGQRLRHSDYTKKTQELAQHKQNLEGQATNQITQYATALAEAQNRISTIMGDLEKEQISAATANARLRTVKTKYGLGDEDIPEIQEVAHPAGTGKPPDTRGGGIDIEQHLKEFKTSLLRELRNDMMAMPRLNDIQADIREEHRELTGKRMSREEMAELLNDAEKRKIRLEDAWRDKYKVDDLRLGKRDEANKKKWEEEWTAKQKARASEDALAGVRRTAPDQSVHQSPVLGREYKQHQDPARVSPPADKSPAPTPNGSPASTNGGPKLSGAERAAAKFLERRSLGIPMGAPEPAKQ